MTPDSMSSQNASTSVSNNVRLNKHPLLHSAPGTLHNSSYHAPHPSQHHSSLTSLTSQAPSSNFMLNPATYSTLIGQLNTSIDNHESDLLRKILHRNAQTSVSSTGTSSGSTQNRLNPVENDENSTSTTTPSINGISRAAAAAAAAAVLNRQQQRQQQQHSSSDTHRQNSTTPTPPTSLQQMAQTQHQTVAAAAAAAQHHPYYHLAAAAAANNSVEHTKRPGSSASSNSSLYVVDSAGGKLNLLDLQTHEFVQNNVSKFSDLDQHHQQLLTHMLGAAGASSLADLPQLKKNFQNGVTASSGIAASTTMNGGNSTNYPPVPATGPSHVFAAAADMYYQQLFSQSQNSHHHDTVDDLSSRDSKSHAHHSMHQQQHSPSMGDHESVSGGSVGTAPSVAPTPVKSNRGRKKSNKGPFICGECRKEFTNQSTLTKHMITHSDERRFVCSQCSKAFKRHDHLTGHMVTHREQKPYACEIEGCDKSYCDARSLRRHREKHGKMLAEGGSSLGDHGTLSLSQQQQGLSSEQAPLYPTAASAQLQYLALQQSAGSSSTLSINKHSENLENDANNNNTTKNCSRQGPSPCTLGDDSSSKSTLKDAEAQYFVGNSENALLHQLLTNGGHLKASQLSDQGTSLPPQSHSAYLESDQNNNNILVDRLLHQPAGSTSENGAHVHVQKMAQHTHSQNFHSMPFTNHGSNESAYQQQQQLQQQQQQSESQHYALHSQLEAYTRNGSLLDTQQQLQPQVSQQQSNRQAQFKIPNSYVYGQQQTTAPSHYSMFETRSNLSAAQQGSQQQPTNPAKQSTQCDTRAMQQSLSQPTVPPAPTHKMPHPQLHEVMFSPITPVTPLNHKPAFTFDFVSSTSVVAPNNAHSEVQAQPRTPQPQQQPLPRVPQQSELLVPEVVAPEVVHSPKLLDQQQQQSQPLTPQIVVTSPLLENVTVTAQQINGVQETENQSFDHFDLPSGKLTSDLYNRRLRKHLSNPNPMNGVVEDYAQEREEIMSIKNSLKSFSQSYEKKRLWQQQQQMHQHQHQHQQQQQQQQHHMQQPHRFGDQPTHLTHSYQVPNTPLVLCGGGNTAAQYMQDYHSANGAQNGIQSVGHSNGYHHSLPNTPIDQSGMTVFNFNFPDAGQLTPENSADGAAPSSASAEQQQQQQTQTTSQQSYCFDGAPFELESQTNDLIGFVDETSASFGTHEEPYAPVIDTQTSNSHFGPYESTTTRTTPTPASSTVGAQFVQEDEAFSTESSTLPLFSTEAIENLTLEAPTETGAIESTVSVSCEPQAISNSLGSPERTAEKRARSPVYTGLTPKKRRPGPLYIPPHVSSLQFQSHLRSPRVRNLSHEAANDDSLFVKPFSPRPFSPPPYTPPPILSPIRSGSGLFWKIKSSFSKFKTRRLGRHPSVLGESSEIDELEPELSQSPSPVEPEMETELQSSISSSGDDTPETDIQPHVNVGPRFQAVIPERRLFIKIQETAQLVIGGGMLRTVPDTELAIYEKVAKSELVRGRGFSLEYTLHQLHKCQGDVMKALSIILNIQSDAPVPVPGYSYPKFNNSWSDIEIKKFERAILKYDKDFFMISREVSSKSTKECVEFYYSWKNCVSVKILNKLRVARRKREREILKENNKNNIGQSNEIDEVSADETKDDPESESSSATSLSNNNNSNATSSGTRSTRGTIYKCTNCNKGFKKLRSRATHMIHCK